LTVLIDRELDNVPDSVLIVFIDRNEPKGLLSAGERRQHFGCAKYCSRVGQEHQVDASALIEGAVQIQQTAGDGNYLQLTSNTESALEAKDSRGWVGKLQSRRSRIGFRWQEISHSQTQLCSPGLEQGTLLKLLPEK